MSIFVVTEYGYTEGAEVIGAFNSLDDAKALGLAVDIEEFEGSFRVASYAYSSSGWTRYAAATTCEWTPPKRPGTPVWLRARSPVESAFWEGKR